MLKDDVAAKPAQDSATPTPHRDAAVAAVKALGAAAGQQMSAGSLKYFAHWLGNPPWLYSGTSLSPNSDAVPPVLSLADDLLIFGNILDHVGCEYLAEHMIARQRRIAGEFSVLAFTHAPTPADVVPMILRSVELGAPQLRPTMHVEGDRAVVTIRPVVPLGRLMMFHTMVFMIPWYTLLEDLVLDGISDFELTFSDMPSSPADDIGSLFRGRILYGQTADGLSFPAAWLALPNPSHDAHLWLLARERMDRAGRIRTQSAEVDRVRARVAETLGRECRVPRLKQVALAEGVSPRKIIRQLVAAGTTFHSIVDEERRSRALALIEDSSLDIQAIADALGFPDRSSFGRKFRTWFGDSPAHFREQKRHP